jgi:transposase
MISDATAVLGLQQEIQRSEESRYDHRLHGVLLVAQGMTCPEVARLLGDAPRSVENWVNRFDRQGLAGLTEGERSGRPSRLDEKQVKEINRVLRAKPSDGGMRVGESLGRQDTVGMDRQNLWNPTGRAPMPAAVPAVRIPSPQASSGLGQSRSSAAEVA